MRAPCAGFAERRSAFVDGALSAADRDRLLVHLAGCDACRADVSDLRTVRELVSQTTDRVDPAPAELSQRLVSIAGGRSDAPVWTVRDRRRRGARIRTTVGGLAVVLAVTVSGVVGYVAAPPDLGAVVDPSVEAEAEFSSVLDQFPLVSDSLSAVLATDPVALAASAAFTSRGPSPATGGVVTATEARAALRRAAGQAGAVGYDGEQSLVAYRSAQALTARVRVVSRPGEGSEISVLDRSGSPLSSDFTPASASSRMSDTELMSLLERNFALDGLRGSVVAGRSATLLQASRAGVVSARWWVDDQTGIVLWQESYDDQGALQVSSGFTQVTIGDLGAEARPAIRPLAAPTTQVAMTLSNADPLAAAGWTCRREVAGLALVKLRTDRADDPTAVHLVYSDGVSTVAVFEQRGRLSGDPAGSHWDDVLQAYVLTGAQSAATWQSGDRVLTVMTNGSAAQLAAAVASLPHATPLERTTMERIQAGWAKIFADMKG